ncbi:MAG TPA: DUF1844 domain-containing protein [Terriglobia bacterium]|nr:DUF1844 domain-containing protein [Terriglobia bacterium]
MPDEKDESTGFKVVDRRSFAVGGERREGSEVPRGDDAAGLLGPRPGPGTEPPAVRRAEAGGESGVIAAGPGPGAAGSESDFEAGEPELTGFETLVSYLATTAWFQLGLIPGPGGERIPVDFVSARRTIDLLEVLGEKTEGNLTPGEAKMLEDVLYELRMGFVEVEKRGAPKRK